MVLRSVATNSLSLRSTSSRSRSRSHEDEDDDDDDDEAHGNDADKARRDEGKAKASFQSGDDELDREQSGQGSVLHVNCQSLNPATRPLPSSRGRSRRLRGAREDDTRRRR
jgi:hypothetical protein